MLIPERAKKLPIIVPCMEPAMPSAERAFDVENVCLSWHLQDIVISMSMMTSLNWNIFLVTGRLCGKFTRHRWISPHKGQWRGALMVFFICAWRNGCINNREAGDLRRHRAHYYVTAMVKKECLIFSYSYTQILSYSYNVLGTICIKAEKFPYNAIILGILIACHKLYDIRQRCGH